MLDFDGLKNIDVRTVDPDTLVDIMDIKIDKELPQEQRLLEYIRQVKNPYCFKCGEIVVALSFAETGPTLEDRIEEYLLGL